MKILHTSDWHVGKTLRGRSRLPEHETVFANMIDLVRREEVDLVLVVGDLFDSAAPQPDAERLVYRTLLELTRAGAQVAVVAGNHDNERRLQAVQPLLELGAVTTRALPAEGLVHVEGRDGARAALALLPWVSKHHIVRAEQLMNLDGAESQQRYEERVKRIIERLCEPMSGDDVNILAAHLSLPLTEGAQGEEVRAAHVFDYAISPNAFPSTLHYTALGHYHRPIEAGGPCPIRYCGSPLWLGFPRTEHESDRKGVYLLDAVPGKPAEIRFEPLEGGRRLRTLRGSLDQLEEAAGAHEDAYLRVVVRDQARAGVAQTVREWFPNAVDVIVEAPKRDDEPARASRTGRAPGELFRDYLTERNATDERVAALFDYLLEEAHAPDPA